MTDPLNTWRMIQHEDGSYWIQYTELDVEYPVHFTEISTQGASRKGRLTEWTLPERSVHATFEACPQCDGGEMMAEHAHYRCRRCGFRDSCCD